MGMVGREDSCLCVVRDFLYSRFLGVFVGGATISSLSLFLKFT